MEISPSSLPVVSLHPGPAPQLLQDEAAASSVGTLLGPLGGGLSTTSPKSLPYSKMMLIFHTSQQQGGQTPTKRPIFSQLLTHRSLVHRQKNHTYEKFSFLFLLVRNFQLSIVRFLHVLDARGLPEN